MSGKNGKNGNGKPSSDIIPFSRWRTHMGRAEGSRKLEALVERPDAARVVAATSPQDLHALIREVGLVDASELLALCTPDQIQSFFDLDIWQKDELDPARMDEWLAALVDLGPKKLGQVIATLDVELPSLWLAKCARVYDLSLGEAPAEDTPHPLLPTPDRFYLIEITAEGDRARLCERLIDFLYRADLDLAKRVVMGARWELPAELEETSYRWRSGRMADLGFADYFDALELYRPLELTAVRIGEGTAIWPETDADTTAQSIALRLDPAFAGSFFARAKDGLGSDEAARVEMALVALANRVMSADRIEPGDRDGARLSLERALGFLSLGLELLAERDLARAAEALRTVALTRLFRLGLSLTLRLGELARALGDKSRARLDPPRRIFTCALAEPIPRLHLPGETSARPFAEAADIRRAAVELELASVEATLPLRLGLSEERGSFGDLFRTACANLWLGREFAPTPLAGASDLEALRTAILAETGELGAEKRDAVLAHVEARLGKLPAQFKIVVDGWLDQLGEELGRLRENPDPRFVGGLIVA